MSINITGETHAIEGPGRTCCNKLFPTNWRHSQHDVTCPKCLRIGRERLELVRAEAQRLAETDGGEAIPFD